MIDREVHPSREAGFTLIEAVTALGVFAIASIALLNIGAQNARTVSALEARTFARIVAGNELVMTLSSADRPRSGTRRGETSLAGREWSWTRAIEKTSDPDIWRVVVTVREGDSETVAATSTGFWGSK